MRRVLISGGSRGIGAECVRRYTSLGDAVAFIYNKSSGSAQALSAETGAIAIQADVSNAVEAKLAVNQAVEKLGDGLIAGAYSEDGIVEAIEHSTHRFCIGLQWHPEHMSPFSKLQRRIFDAFVRACCE